MMLEKVNLNNVYYYLLPREQRLYKGLSDLSRVTNIKSYEWYGLSIETAETYGHIYIYSNNVPLKLFAMDERSNIELLLRSARLQGRQDVIDSLKETFKLYEAEENVIRNSEDEHDRKVVEFLCKNGYEGYGSDKMQKALNSNDFFHSEICICNAPSIIAYQDEKIVTAKSETSFVNKQPLGKKKRTRDFIGAPTNNVVRDLFMEQSPPKRNVVRSLFQEQQERDPRPGRALFLDEEEEAQEDQEPEERRALFLDQQNEENEENEKDENEKDEDEKDEKDEKDEEEKNEEPVKGWSSSEEEEIEYSDNEKELENHGLLSSEIEMLY